MAISPLSVVKKQMTSERWSLFAANLMKPRISLMLLSGRKAGLQVLRNLDLVP